MKSKFLVAARHGWLAGERERIGCMPDISDVEGLQRQKRHAAIFLGNQGFSCKANANCTNHQQNSNNRHNKP